MGNGVLPGRALCAQNIASLQLWSWPKQEVPMPLASMFDCIDSAGKIQD